MCLGSLPTHCLVFLSGKPKHSIVVKQRIAIFASGNGTNAKAILNHFANHTKAEVAMTLSNKANAGVLVHAKKVGIPTCVFDRSTFKNTNQIIDMLQAENISLIVLAGFLWQIPQQWIKAFPNQIINLHPALLPKYGGKGMYGIHVHKAVKTAGEKESGITIHYVNEHYDKGQIIHQVKCEIAPEDSPEDIAGKVRLLEHEFFPKTIEKLILERTITNKGSLESLS